jgi:hypothetical protein
VSIDKKTNTKEEVNLSIQMPVESTDPVNLPEGAGQTPEENPEEPAAPKFTQ